MQALASNSLIKSMLLPRSVVAWIQTVGDVNCELPGLPGTSLVLRKSASGFTGSLTCNGTYTFSNDTLETTVATIAVSLGAEQAAYRAKDVDLARLGKTIDLLIKAQVGQPSKAPEAPTAPAMHFKKPSIPKSTSTMQLSEKESLKPCKVCGEKQMKDGKFVGCCCLKDIAKSVQVVSKESGYELTFGADWDLQAVKALEKRVKNVT